MKPVSHLLLLLVLLDAAYLDFKKHRIPNKLLLTDLVLESLIRFSAPEEYPFLYLITFLLLIILLSPLFILTHTGGGDLKLTALILAVCPLEKGCLILLTGCCLSLFYILYRTVRTGKCGTFSERLRRIRFPFAVPLLIGSVPYLLPGCFPVFRVFS